MTFENKKPDRLCDDCSNKIKVGDLVYLECDVKFVCKNCIGDNYKKR